MKINLYDNGNSFMVTPFIESLPFMEITEEQFNKILAGKLKLQNGKLVDNSKNLLIENLRHKRNLNCFNIVNRGEVWYGMLTNEQRTELVDWYKKWLDVTETMQEPEKPSWLK